jgi:hypothetical protein
MVTDANMMAHMAAALEAAFAAQVALRQGGAPGVTIPKPSRKVGGAKVQSDVEGALRAGKFPPVMKLSRANLARLQEDNKVSRRSRYVRIGGDSGVELRLPDDCKGSSSPTGARYADGELWSGLSAFNRLFSIMVQLPEADFPRSALVDFFGVWREMWDSPMGTRTQKMRAVLAFYDKYAGSLGRGAWLSTFDSDSRFLLTHLRGRNPPTCPCCAGTGEMGSRCAASNVASPDVERADVDADSEDDKSSEAGSDSPSPDGQDGLCPSMEYTSVDCEGDMCELSHVCPCGGGCYSARDCPGFDVQEAPPVNGYGDEDDVEVERAAKRRRA